MRRHETVIVGLFLVVGGWANSAHAQCGRGGGGGTTPSATTSSGTGFATSVTPVTSSTYTTQPTTTASQALAYQQAQLQMQMLAMQQTYLRQQQQAAIEQRQELLAMRRARGQRNRELREERIAARGAARQLESLGRASSQIAAAGGRSNQLARN